MREPLNLLSLFAGIGGFELGLERSGLCKTVAQVEIDPFCQKVLAKHWPEVKRYDDVRTLTAAQLARDGLAVDVICGGFPCQDISTAGKGAGIEGERSGLWREFARLVGELRPRYVFVENVAALLGRGLGRVLGDLASIGYDAEWHCIPASAVGAPHRRDRLWIVAYPSSKRQSEAGESRRGCEKRAASAGDASDNVANADNILHPRELDARGNQNQATGSQSCHLGEGQAPHRQQLRFKSSDSSQVIPNTNSQRLSVINDFGDSGSPSARVFKGGELERTLATSGAEQWRTEPAIRRVANGVPNRVDRLRSLGNAVVPQIPEMLGRAVLEAEATYA